VKDVVGFIRGSVGYSGALIEGVNGVGMPLLRE
jgi:hypothetical protein